MALKGEIRVPSDKSLSHRAVLFAALASGTSHLRSVLPSADVHATISAVAKLGAQVRLERGAFGYDACVEGIGLVNRLASPVTIDCGNSGTSARLLLGVLAGLGVDATLVGDDSLSKRPMKRVMEPLQVLGARFESDEGNLPVRVVPVDGLHSAQIRTEQASAQVKSAILLAGMQAPGVTSVTEPSKSRDHTELLLPAFGVAVTVEGLTSSVTGPASMHSHDMTIPGDPSSAAFIAVTAALLPGSDVLISDVALNPTRTGAFEVLRRMGCSLEYLDARAEGEELVGDVRVTHAPELEGAIVSASEIPSLIDEIPILAIAAACARGETVFESCGELRVKESDRLAAILQMLFALEVEAFVEGDDLHVIGLGSAGDVKGGPLDVPTRGDHRIAMTLHCANVAFDLEDRIDDRECVAVSWPRFFEDVDRLVC